MTNKVAIVIAAKNEVNNIAAVVRAASKFGQVIVVNDGSTDGTGGEASMAGADVITHLRSTHIKIAYRDGFKAAIHRGFDIIVQMDAGLSHNPVYIPDLLAALEIPGVYMAIGSRFVPGGRALGQTFMHELLSRGGGVLIRLCAGLKFADPTSGFRAYRVRVLQTSGLLSGIKARAHAFQFELLYRIDRLGFAIPEVPIIYMAGRSSVRPRVVFEALVTLCRLTWDRVFYGGKGWMFR